MQASLPDAQSVEKDSATISKSQTVELLP